MDAGQEHAIQAFDQQLYATAQQVTWSRPDIFEPHILRIGGFHSLLIFTLGKLWADWGIRDLLVDYDVHAGNTVEQMLTGKQFNRAVRGFTLVFNSLNIIYTAAFIHWCRTFDHFEETHYVLKLCLISILISMKYLHDQEICYQAVWSKEKLSNVSSWHEQIACENCN